MRLRVDLPQATWQALVALAVRERRNAGDEAALLLIQTLARRRLVSSDGLTIAGAHRLGEAEAVESR